MYVSRNIEARSCNRCCCGKEMSIAYPECVFVALVIQHAMSMRRIILSAVAGAALPYFFPHYHINCTNFGKKFMEHKVCFYVLYS